MQWHVKGLLTYGLVAVLTVTCATAVTAQTPNSTATTTQPAQPLTVVDTTADQSPIAPVAPVNPPYWSSIGGFEADSHETGYGFFGPQYVRPFRPNVAFIAGANLNYLYYEFDTPTGHENVRSPGVNTMAGLRFGRTNWFTVQAGPGFKRRQFDVVDASGNLVNRSSQIDVGLNVSSAAWINPTTHNNLYAQISHATEDNYTWGRVAFKEQVGNMSWSGKLTPFVGAEYIGQGNDDIMSQQYGGFFELTHVPSTVSVMFRAGYKRSSFDFGPDKTGPWFAIGFYQRLR
jgi:cellulose biosynthesis protein BcsS